MNVHDQALEGRVDKGDRDLQDGVLFVMRLRVKLGLGLIAALAFRAISLVAVALGLVVAGPVVMAKGRPG